MNEPRTHKPLVVLVGAGPGEASLITLAGAQWLGRADTVVYDRLIGQAMLRSCRSDAELIYVGKGPGNHAMTQEQINALLVERFSRGELVVRLKGGDPYIFGRGGEEADALAAAGCEFRVVPGVTAATAAAAYAGIPLTQRGSASTVAFVTGHEDHAKIESAIDFASLAAIDTVVFYMGVGNLPAVADNLIRAGRAGETPAAIVENAATPRQRTVVATLATIAAKAQKANVKAPGVVIVGDAADRSGALGWFERLGLFGKTVIVTRAGSTGVPPVCGSERGRPLGIFACYDKRSGHGTPPVCGADIVTQARELSDRLVELGAEVIEAPAIAVEPVEDFTAVDEALRRVGDFDWLVLTSPNGVSAMVERMGFLGLDGRALGGVRVAAVGAGTAAALQRHFITADLVPEEFTTVSLGDALRSAGSIKDKRFFLLRSDLAGPQLPDALRSAGADVNEISIYRTVRPAALPAEALEALRNGRVDWITFTSSSTVENFLAMALAAAPGVDLSQVKLAAIGPVTAEALRSHGLAPTVVAERHDIPGLIEAILRSR